MLQQVVFTNRYGRLCVAVADPTYESIEVEDLEREQHFVLASGSSVGWAIRPFSVISRDAAPCTPAERGEQLLAWYEALYSQGTNTDVSAGAAISDLLHALEADYRSTGDWDDEDPDALDSVTYVLEAARNSYLEERS